MGHRLDALLRPRSVAVVGASARKDSLGEWSLKNLRRGGYRGRIYPVNPGYAELDGLACFATLQELPEVPELVIFAVGDARLEAVFDAALAIGCPAAVIMSTGILDNDTAPPLRQRLRQKIAASGMLVCGANGMGFYNVRDHVWACGFDSRRHEAPGNVALISHSGAGMSGIIDSEERLRINLAVSTGNELGVTLDEYLDFALDLPETRVVGLFIETARRPQALCRALAKANERRIPVVAIKVGKTEAAAKLTVSHSGAMAGNDDAFAALFDRYGVQRVRDMDELATALILFAECHPVAAGGLVTLHDSGGERQLLIDLAAKAGVPLAKLSASTVARLEAVLEPELPAVNPLDAWSRGGADAGARMAECLALLLQDDAAGFGAAVLNRAPDGRLYPAYLDYLKHARKAAGKPVALVAARQGSGHDELAVSSTHAGYPVLDGIAGFLVGVRALFDYRDFLLRDPPSPPAFELADAGSWHARLQQSAVLSEQESLQLLKSAGLPVIESAAVDNAAAAAEAAGQIGYPVALKTAAGIAHKSDRGGVILDIRDEAALLAAYAGLSARLGPEAVVAAMAPAGVEMLLGASRDTDFGPLVTLGFGGIWAELRDDAVCALPPFDRQHVRRLLDRLRSRPRLDGGHGLPPADIDAFCALAADFSVLLLQLGDAIAEIDLNPVIVHAGGCTIVDALLLPAAGATRTPAA